MAVHGVKKSSEATEVLSPSTDATATVPKDRLPEGEWDPRLAHRLVRDELMVEGNARLNTATFSRHGSSSRCGRSSRRPTTRT